MVAIRNPTFVPPERIKHKIPRKPKIPMPSCPHFTRQSNQSSITTSSPNIFILLRRTVLL